MKVTSDIAHNHRDTYWDGNSMLQALHAAERWLQQHVPAINQMNVFPVPDGDTGTNMHLTLSAALYGVVPVASCALLADQVYRGALMGARGNSGVILSQILRGIASGLAEHDVCGPEEFVHALEAASATAYHSTSDPREGTILTVIRETSEAVRAAFETHTHTLHSLLAVAVDAARAAVERTPTMLAVLREAGVVDAGGQGLYIIFDGMHRWNKGEPFELVPQPIPNARDALTPHAMLHGENEYGYCTNLLVQGTELPFEVIRTHMEEVGTSTVVVGDSELIRIHVHTERPGDILNYVMQFGEPLKIEISNMDQQRREINQQAIEPLAPEPAARRSTAQVGVVIVAAGAGFTTLFTSLGGDAVALVSGGQTANPSTSELLEAAERLPQSEVIVLPNNGNVLLAAQQAASMSQKQIAVLPTKPSRRG
ncbi:MAG: DAK2 domain-containing protein [Chloroflexaceae bacterium]|nr:DAK2 domain-containing protein [Chloroflexaceae bacterium]